MLTKPGYRESAAASALAATPEECRQPPLVPRPPLPRGSQSAGHPHPHRPPGGLAPPLRARLGLIPEDQRGAGPVRADGVPARHPARPSPARRPHAQQSQRARADPGREQAHHRQQDRESVGDGHQRVQQARRGQHLGGRQDHRRRGRLADRHVGEQPPCGDFDRVRRVRRDRQPACLQHLRRPVQPLHPVRRVGGAGAYA